LIPLPSRLREIVDELEAARKRLLASVDSLSQEELDLAAGDRWSIGEILNHLRLTEDSAVRVLQKLADKAEKSGLGPDLSTESVLHILDRFNIESAADRLVSPASVAPAKGIAGRQLHSDLSGSRAALMKALENCARFDMTQVSFPHPVFGKLDGYQWAVFVARHEERHRRQIEGLKALRPGRP
jgi:hypothetical protein